MLVKEINVNQLIGGGIAEETLVPEGNGRF